MINLWLDSYCRRVLGGNVKMSIRTNLRDTEARIKSFHFYFLDICYYFVFILRFQIFLPFKSSPTWRTSTRQRTPSSRAQQTASRRRVSIGTRTRLIPRIIPNETWAIIRWSYRCTTSSLETYSRAGYGVLPRMKLEKWSGRPNSWSIVSIAFTITVCIVERG